jgi:prophage endopeptidase
MSLYANIIIAAIFVGVTVGAYIQGRADGTRVTKAEYLQRDLQASEEARIAERGIAARERAKEQDWQKRFVAASTDYQKRIAANETQRLADMAAVDARTLILRDPNSAVQTCPDRTGEIAGSASGRDGGPGSELPPKTAQFLLSLAGEADSVVGQLTACQAILRSERQVNSPPPDSTAAP